MLDKTYDHGKVEHNIYEQWLKSGYFNPDNLKGKPYTIMMPPPNVTGTLHIGHALFVTIQDILIRWRRMQGRKTLWLPGTDHAAIATQSKVEAELYKKEKKTRHDLGREHFLKLVEDFAQNSHDIIVSQLKRMGASCDWSREAYTLDETRNLAVRTAFKNMYDSGIIYKGARIVNWDPKLQTTVSDDEIEWKEQTTPFYYLKYGPFTIGTARPETKFGDKYVVMHPDDARYKQYRHGQKIKLEWINGPVVATVIKDEAIDMEFGTGVMTITPWHDATDFEIAMRHNLDKEPIIDERGLLLPIAGEFAGLHIKKARPLIVEKLQKKGLVEKIEENYVHRVATNSRGGGLIEPQIKEQWFINVNKRFTVKNSKLKSIKSGTETTLKELMRSVVENGEIQIIPKHFEKIYFHWIDNLRDWCISRQIWFGHRVPVWYCGIGALPKMGFHKDVVPQVVAGKTKTYRLRDHNLSIGDKVAFENSQTKELFGYGLIKHIEHTTVSKINLQDPAHGVTYQKVEELIEAFKKHHPQTPVIPETPVIIYTYEFRPAAAHANLGCGETIVATNEPATCPRCGCPILTQDPNTLDTWFSSGLWTFSTLGWPKNTKDLQTFHPTDVLETGYDILFFWVARMILMTTYHLGDIPFHYVYLHGLVRDKDRQKMSKSKGNVIDPLGVIDLYGTDALRFALIFSTAAGNDIPLSEDKIRGMKYFANKLWNISRFVITNLENAKFELQISDWQTEGLTEADKNILKKLDSAITSTTNNLEAFRLHEAAQAIYQFIWHEFADIYIEKSKEQLKDDKLADHTRAVLLHCLTVILKLLHPFMPFITEHIWGLLQERKLLDKNGLLMVAQWPNQ